MAARWIAQIERRLQDNSACTLQRFDQLPELILIEKIAFLAEMAVDHGFPLRQQFTEIAAFEQPSACRERSRLHVQRNDNCSVSSTS